MERNSREKKTRFKLKKAAPLEAILPLQRPLSEPVSFPEAPQVDGLAVGQVLPGDINLRREEKWNVGRERGRERCDGWEMNGGEGGGRASMPPRIFFSEKLALGKTPSVSVTGRVVPLCNSPIASFQQRAGRTDGREVK